MYKFRFAHCRHEISEANKKNKTKVKIGRTSLILALLTALSCTLLSCQTGTPALTLPNDIYIASGYDEPSSTSDNTSTSIVTENSNTPQISYEYITDISAYLKYIAPQLPTEFSILVNKNNAIDRDYAPADCIKLDSSLTLYGKEVMMSEYAAVAATAMLLEMRACGFTNIYVTSGYRSYDYQNQLYNQYISNERAKHPSWSEEQIIAEVLSYSAYPGTSEHQTGLCCDFFISPGMTSLVNYGNETANDSDFGFAESSEYNWLIENAYKFGFILRFGKDKEAITGYSYESWHYRFVGREAATEIYTKGLCYEEYVNGT